MVAASNRFLSPGSGERLRQRLSSWTAVGAVVGMGLWRLLRRRVQPAISAVVRHGLCAVGWAVDRTARGLRPVGRAGAQGAGRYVAWWSRAGPATGRRMVDATGWLLGQAIRGVQLVSRRLVPSFTGFMAVAAATTTWVILVVAATVPAIGGYGDVVDIELVVPENSALPTLAERSVVYAADGSVLAVLHDEQDRRLVALDTLPDHVWQSVIAAEDRRFFEHEGYDVEAITRAAVANVRARGVAQGGSTITQQLAKQNFLSDEQTLERKAQELTYAMALEERLTKRELLERYLNQVYFGGGAYGVAAAAEEWFAVPPEELSLEQAALLAGMIRSPGRLDPRDNPEGATLRRNGVLRGMAEEGYISHERADFAVDVPMLVMPRRERTVTEPFFVEAVKKEFFDNPAFGGDRATRIDRLFNGGLAIHTTIEPRLQQAAHHVVERHYPAAVGARTSAIAAVDPRTGRVVATHSGVDFGSEAYDLATQGRRHPGSAFKTVVLATALEHGRPIDSTVNGSGPREFDWDPHQEPYRVRNFGNSSYGTITLHDALVRSVNTAFVDLILATGINRVVEKSRDFGIDVDAALGDPSNHGPAIAIGGMYRGVTPLEMASAIGSFATRGRRAEPYLIERVEDAGGEELYRHQRARTKAVSPQTAQTMLEAMQAVVARGTGTRAQLPGWPVAGKTGTAQNFADAWFVGTTPVLSAAVWVGNPDGRVPYPGMTGGQFAAPVWRDFMTLALDGVPPRPFPPGPAPSPQPEAEHQAEAGSDGAPPPSIESSP